MNREEWLTKVSKEYVLPLLKAHDGSIDYKYRVSVGWPKGSRGGRGGEAIGQCWPPSASADKVHEIFISPRLAAFQAVETLIHEHIHGSAGLKCAHRGEFKRLALAVGFKGKMTETPTGPELAAIVAGWIKKLPEYPHGVMTLNPRAKKPGSRLVKVSCPGCGYTMRTTRKWIEVAVPACPNSICEHEGDAMEVQS